MSILLATSYTWSQFGREAEITIAIYMKCRGWGVKAITRKQRTSRYYCCAQVNKMANPGKIKYENTEIEGL